VIKLFKIEIKKKQRLDVKKKKKKEEKREENLKKGENWAPPGFEHATYGLKTTHDSTAPWRLACKWVRRI
jgi:hypothetical protein